MNIHVASNLDDLERVREFRRTIFAYELDESIDRHSTNVFYERDGELVGAVRFTLRSDGPLEDEPPLCLPYWREEFEDHEISQCSRFAVTWAHRGTGVGPQLISHIYARILHEGVRLLFIDCTLPLVRYYRRLGFRHFRAAYRHPLLKAPIMPLVLFVGDLPHFIEVGSLLASMTPHDGAQRARSLVVSKPRAHALVDSPAQLGALADLQLCED
jgi:GNAT superfamily N-acetyltransferase